MSKQDIVDRILSDARAEAEAVLATAEESAARILAEAERRAESEMQATRAAVEAKCKSVKDGKAASARLDGAKILLGEKRGVIDALYASALDKLRAMKPKDCLALTERLLKEYAEEGDEIVFADGFPCPSEVSALQVVKDRKLKITFGGADFVGGFVLRGKTSDKDLSYGALLAADRAEHEAEIAVELFN